MLKALELSGFKSFADKTRFEFPPGITVVVGPNGSGKSNIVDAIKWVLGEQSAKSLRGKDMSDVIFKGSSGANARRPANAATATIILDNVDKRFAFDADEVHVTRRVYRSGESEYLINGESTRLKDIKELFRGTGVGTDAYSLIEQGKVERMLSTSPKERRTIFEEAAGISRFKAKKVEAQRRLARVEGNLIRLADIVEEVGSRYRSVKSQASKASRYKEYADRLQQLRTYVGLNDWRTFCEKIETIQTESTNAIESEKTLTTEIAELGSGAKAVESSLDQTSTALAKVQESTSGVRENIAQTDSLVSLNQQRLQDLEERKLQQSEQLERAKKRTVELKDRIKKSESESEAAELSYREAADQLKGFETELQSLDGQILSLRGGNETRRSQYSELRDLVTSLGRQVSSYDSQAESVGESKSRLESKVAGLTAETERYHSDVETFTGERERLQKKAESKDSALASFRKQYDEYKSSLAGRKERLSDLTSEHAGLSQRAEVIEELERSLEGINAGAKEILQRAKMPPVANEDGSGAVGSSYHEVIGLVADLVSVNVQHAAIVDVALGEMAQYVVVDGDSLINEIADEQLKLTGRVGLIQLNSPPTLGADPNVNLNGAPGVIGRTDRLVQVQPEFTSFIRHLLGGTWVVKTLGAALHLYATRGDTEKIRLVTLDGEIVEPDGTVVAGPKSLSSGLVSRRSELRALKREIERLTEEISQCRAQVKELIEKEAESEANVQSQLNENKELATRLADQTIQAKSAGKNLAKANQELQQSTQELTSASEKLAQVTSQLTSDREQLTANELAITTLNALIATDDTKSNESQKQRTNTEQAATAAKVKLAKAEQFLDGLQSRAAQNRQEFEEHQLASQQLETQRDSDDKAMLAAQVQIETGTESLKKLELEREELTDQLTQLSQQRDEVDAKRREIAIEQTGKRDLLRLTSDKLHQSKMRIEQILMQRDQLAERMQDDYGIDIASLEETPTEEELEQRDQVDTEISQLRKRISDIGSVNLDALSELEELESRYTSMDEQYQDLVNAKETLQKIIVRIDADSRKLFVETLEAIRISFQKLFRQTFGGGQADIILEEGVDPLEAGVEIIATPPGKPQFNNSLLSGGEKALTAVSLLMAIFQFRPSPFCVLDEVDAPFDEANIGRFIDVLKSFLGWTKFVIVTHSKKTMTAATTLYGITMQESGVSKRVSVRFEDVSEDGHISEEAIQRADDDAA